MENRRRKSATVEDPGGGSSSLDDSEDGTDGISAKERLKARFLAELRERRLHEETARQLQRNYEDLLRSHAEKELTIEQLRLGARVSLMVDPPAPSRAMPGTLPGPQRAVLFSVPKAGVATVTAMSTAAPQSAMLLSTANHSMFAAYSTVAILDCRGAGSGTAGRAKCDMTAPYQSNEIGAADSRESH